MTHRVGTLEMNERRSREKTYAVSSNVDCFENHDASLVCKSQKLVDVDVVVHKGGGKRGGC